MTRPQSILWFERCFIGSMAVSLISAAFNWSTIQDSIEAIPDSAILPSWYIPAMMLSGIVLNLVIWFFVARRGSVVAKWIATVFFGLGAVGMVFTLFGGHAAASLSPTGIVAWLLSAVAIWMLFRPDAKAWFSGDRSADLTRTFS